MTAAPAPERSNGTPREQTYRSIYPLRILGMGLGLWVTCSVLIQTGDLARYGWLSVLTMLIWPHLAYVHARFSRDPYRAEIRNLLIDSAITGLWIPLMHFNLLPSVVLAVITTHDKFSTGIKRLWLVSLPGMVGMALLGTLILRPEPVWASSLPVIIATLPVIALHSLAVGFASYRLIRTVARQNRQLKDLRERDAQTGLYARAHWQEQAQAVLEGARRNDRPAWLLMIDIDHFKPINDVHGHTVGDEAIRVVGEAIREAVRDSDCAGRYGGDEFAVVCADTEQADALAIAQRIRERIAALRLPELPEMRLTSSIGMAQARSSHHSLREWLSSADMAMYRAKHGGRNRVAVEPRGSQAHPADGATDQD
ncbi:MAG: diguanylate cyclase [Burkholderiaceae bacterium]|jgi:diguanylate cyclase|nr:diguanylate cyclase [Burkholderiaceae bacterium]